MITVKSTLNGRVLTYIHVHRTGGTAFMAALAEHPALETVCEHRPHLDAHETLQTYGDTIAAAYPSPETDYRMLALIRHPLPWLVSQWALVEHPRHAGGGHVLNGRWPAFADFAREYAREAPGYVYQYPLVYADHRPDRRLIPHHLYRYDTSYDRAWRWAAGWLGITLPPRRDNEATASALERAGLDHWTDCYRSAALRDHVLRTFATDLHLWTHDTQP